MPSNNYNERNGKKHSQSRLGGYAPPCPSQNVDDRRPRVGKIGNEFFAYLFSNGPNACGYCNKLCATLRELADHMDECAGAKNGERICVMTEEPVVTINFSSANVKKKRKVSPNALCIDTSGSDDCLESVCNLASKDDGLKKALRCPREGGDVDASSTAKPKAKRNMPNISLEVDARKEFSDSIPTEPHKDAGSQEHATHGSKVTKLKFCIKFPFGGEDADLDQAAHGLTEAQLALTSSAINDEKKVEILNGKQSDVDAKKAEARSHVLTIRDEDLELLDHGNFLNKTLIDFWMQCLKKDSTAAVQSWTAKENIDIFSKRFIFIPINENLHWSLCVVVNPSHIFNSIKLFEEEIIDEEESPASCILFLDSLKGRKKTTVAKRIRKWLNSEWERLKGETEDNLFTPKTMKVFSPSIPYQDNSWDCGVFVCRYAFAIFMNRGVEVIVDDVVDEMNNYIQSNAYFQFDTGDIERIRDELKILITNLAVLYIDTNGSDDCFESVCNPASKGDGLNKPSQNPREGSDADASSTTKPKVKRNMPNNSLEVYDQKEFSDSIPTEPHEDNQRESSHDIPAFTSGSESASEIREAVRKRALDEQNNHPPEMQLVVLKHGRGGKTKYNGKKFVITRAIKGGWVAGHLQDCEQKDEIKWRLNAYEVVDIIHNTRNPGAEEETTDASLSNLPSCVFAMIFSFLDNNIANEENFRTLQAVALSSKILHSRLKESVLVAAKLDNLPRFIQYTVLKKCCTLGCKLTHFTVSVGYGEFDILEAIMRQFLDCSELKELKVYSTTVYVDSYLFRYSDFSPKLDKHPMANMILDRVLHCGLRDKNYNTVKFNFFLRDFCPKLKHLRTYIRRDCFFDASGLTRLCSLDLVIAPRNDYRTKHLASDLEAFVGSFPSLKKLKLSSNLSAEDVRFSIRSHSLNEIDVHDRGNARIFSSVQCPKLKYFKCRAHTYGNGVRQKEIPIDSYEDAGIDPMKVTLHDVKFYGMDVPSDCVIDIV